MRYVKWVLLALILIVMTMFLHYTLPQRDIVQVVGTEIKRVNVEGTWTSIFWASPDAGQVEGIPNRDVRFINVKRPNGSPFVYRNEDTDWGWPPYFKFDSGNLTAEAQGLEKEQWVAISHYGWRFPIFSIYPNAVNITRVDGPDTFLFPWFNTVFFLFLALVLFGIYRLVMRFKARRVDPVLEDIDEMVDNIGEGIGESAEQAQAGAEAVKRGFLGWFKHWFGSSGR